VHFLPFKPLAKMILSEKDLQLLSSMPTINDSDNDRKDNDLKIGKNLGLILIKKLTTFLNVEFTQSKRFKRSLNSS
jgi:hypothetical protein